jgi:hypothetical protein
MGERHIQVRDSALEEALDSVLVKTIYGALLLGSWFISVVIAVSGNRTGIGLLRGLGRAEILPDKGWLTEWVEKLADVHFDVLDNLQHGFLPPGA